MHEGLWGIVSKTEAEPEPDTDRYAKLAVCRDRALATIVLSLDPSLLYLIGDPTDPAVAWDKLYFYICRKTWANRLTLRRRLHSLKLKEGQSAHNHVTNIIKTFNELPIVEDEFSNEDRVVYLLASLLDSFDELVTALEASSTVPEMETVIEHLLREEQKLKEKDLQSSTADPNKSHDNEAYKKRTPISLLWQVWSHSAKLSRQEGSRKTRLQGSWRDLYSTIDNQSQGRKLIMWGSGSNNPARRRKLD
uniref:Uncharacterized protein n=1 Tax=Amphimedon queenslandica TaxID=400682 RepID=A0A1X7VJZ4_AMPQE